MGRLFRTYAKIVVSAFDLIHFCTYFGKLTYISSFLVKKSPIILVLVDDCSCILISCTIYFISFFSIRQFFLKHPQFLLIIQLNKIAWAKGKTLNNSTALQKTINEKLNIFSYVLKIPSPPIAM